MQIIHPKKPRKDFNKLEELPSSKGGGSGYFLISVVKSGLDLYICFCNAQRDKVYIEKTHTLNPNKFMCVEDLQLISDDKEFDIIHKFLIDNKVLNG